MHHRIVPVNWTVFLSFADKKMHPTVNNVDIDQMHQVSRCIDCNRSITSLPELRYGNWKMYSCLKFAYLKLH